MGSSTNDEQNPQPPQSAPNEIRDVDGDEHNQQQPQQQQQVRPRNNGLSALQGMINYLSSACFTEEEKVNQYRIFSRTHYGIEQAPPIDMSQVMSLELNKR